MNSGSRIAQPIQHHLLIEYKAAQKTARHYEQLLWLTTTLIGAADLLLLGLALGSLGSPAARLALSLAGILGVTLCAFNWILARSFNALLHQAQKHCKEIELLLCIRHQPALPRGVRRMQRLLFALILILLSLAWLVVIITAWL